jgi:hypothetical protein
MICGPLRGIPFYWRLIDCSFGILGAIPLIYCMRLLPRVAREARAKIRTNSTDTVSSDMVNEA